MEEFTDYSIITKLEPGARLSHARAAKTAIEGFRKNREKLRLRPPEIETETILGGSLADYEEFEIGHNLPEGTFKSIFELMQADLEAKQADSVVSYIRRQNALYSLRDIKIVATHLVAKTERVRGIGPKKAQLLLSSTAVLINLWESYPDRMA